MEPTGFHDESLPKCIHEQQQQQTEDALWRITTLSTHHTYTALYTTRHHPARVGPRWRSSASPGFAIFSRSVVILGDPCDLRAAASDLDPWPGGQVALGSCKQSSLSHDLAPILGRRSAVSDTLRCPYLIIIRGSYNQGNLRKGLVEMVACSRLLLIPERMERGPAAGSGKQGYRVHVMGLGNPRESTGKAKGTWGLASSGVGVRKLLGIFRYRETCGGNLHYKQ